MSCARRHPDVGGEDVEGVVPPGAPAAGLPPRRQFRFASVAGDVAGHVDGGDVLRIGRTIYVGRSSRTDAAGIAELDRIATALGYRVIEAQLRDFLLRTSNYVFHFNASTWGWVHLVLGLLLAVAGAFIFTGNPVACGVGIFVAGLSAIANFLWLPYYPFWALTVLALDIFVIWGLARCNLGNSR